MSMPEAGDSSDTGKSKFDPKQRFLNDALQYAVQTDNQDRVEQLLRQGADPQWKCKITGLTPAQCALKLEHIDLLKLLLDSGEDAFEFFAWLLDSSLMFPLPYQIVWKHPEVLTYLLVHVKPGVDCSWEEWGILVNDLTDRWYCDQVKMFKTILNCGFVRDLEEESAGTVELDGHTFERAKRRDVRLDMLGNAIKGRSLECVQMLLDDGVPDNVLLQKGKTLLHAASESGSLEIVEDLLKRGAAHVKNEKGVTPLDIAYKKELTTPADIVRLFISKGFSSEMVDTYKLHVACLLGEEEKVKKMIEDGANVNEIDVEGRSPLIFGIQGGNLTVLQLLLKAGANPDPARNKEIKKLQQYIHPITHAIHARKPEALSCLLDSVCGARPLNKVYPKSHKMLVDAGWHSDFETFNVLLERGADIASKKGGNSAITAPCENGNGNLEMLKAVVAKGGDVNHNAAIEYDSDGNEIKEDEEDCLDDFPCDFRPLGQVKDAACIRFLLEKGAYVHCVSSKEALAEFLEMTRDFPFPGVPDVDAKQRQMLDVIGPDLDSNGHNCPPYIGILDIDDDNALDCMKAYFDLRGSKIRNNDMLFIVACHAGKFKVVEYLLTENTKWLLQFGLLHKLLKKKPCSFSSDRFDKVEYRRFCYVKMMGTLFNLGGTFNFTRDKSAEGSGNADDKQVTRVEDTVVRILTQAFITQRFICCKILQELCGRNLCLDLSEILEKMKNCPDYALISLLLNCGHSISQPTFLAARKQRRPDMQFVALCDKVEEMQHQPLGLQSLCRIKIRSELFKQMDEYCYINKTIQNLPLAKPIREFLSFSGQQELSYLVYAVDGPVANDRPAPQRPYRYGQEEEHEDDEDCDGDAACSLM